MARDSRFIERIDEYRFRLDSLRKEHFARLCEVEQSLPTWKHPYWIDRCVTLDRERRMRRYVDRWRASAEAHTLGVREATYALDAWFRDEARRIREELGIKG